jgi:hypothetical protein
MLDPAVANDQGQPLDQDHAGDLEGRKAESAREAQVGVAQHRKWQVQPLRHLTLIIRGLRA